MSKDKTFSFSYIIRPNKLRQFYNSQFQTRNFEENSELLAMSKLNSTWGKMPLFLSTPSH